MYINLTEVTIISVFLLKVAKSGGTQYLKNRVSHRLDLYLFLIANIDSFIQHAYLVVHLSLCVSKTV